MTDFPFRVGVVDCEMRFISLEKGVLRSTAAAASFVATLMGVKGCETRGCLKDTRTTSEDSSRFSIGDDTRPWISFPRENLRM